MGCNHLPAKKYCEGDGDKHPWWKACCHWVEEAKACEAKGSNPCSHAEKVRSAEDGMCRCNAGKVWNIETSVCDCADKAAVKNPKTFVLETI